MRADATYVEGVVLLGIKNLEQGGSGITMEIALTDLVDLIPTGRMVR